MNCIWFDKVCLINHIWFNEFFSCVWLEWQLRYHYSYQVMKHSYQEMKHSHYINLLLADLWSVSSFVYIESCQARLLSSLTRLQNIAFAICYDITNLTALFIVLVNSSTESSISIFPLESFLIISWTLLIVQL